MKTGSSAYDAIYGPTTAATPVFFSPLNILRSVCHCSVLWLHTNHLCRSLRSKFSLRYITYVLWGSTTITLVSSRLHSKLFSSYITCSVVPSPLKILLRILHALGFFNHHTCFVSTQNSSLRISRALWFHTFVSLSTQNSSPYITCSGVLQPSHLFRLVSTQNSSLRISRALWFHTLVSLSTQNSSPYMTYYGVLQLPRWSSLHSIFVFVLFCLLYSELCITCSGVRQPSH